MVFQNPFASLNPSKRISTQLLQAQSTKDKRAKSERLQEIVSLVSLLGINEKGLDKFPQEFSGGQLQRIAIARALLLNPSILICDEPTSALDVTVQANIIDLLKRLNDVIGITIIFISHDLAVCRHMCDFLYVLNQGRICESGSTLDVLDRPQDPYTQSLIEASIPFRKVS